LRDIQYHPRGKPPEPGHSVVELKSTMRWLPVVMVDVLAEQPTPGDAGR
jgi:hypothetical protein